MTPLLTSLLKRYFGYDSFRPCQQDIVADALAGRDVFAVLPTGGGKSLCFQLPALMLPGLTVVVSPLIALMKDQVDALQAAGVAATFLNSSLAASEARARLHGLHNGDYRLLYVAPERLFVPEFLDDLRSWQVALFAIDEAHCISEWGHDFRPEYRQLVTLRSHFPAVPLMALTATATERVRADIISQLNLRMPATYLASFNRPNLTYRVVGKSGAYPQTLGFIQDRVGESGIIYCQSRKSVEQLAERLSADNIPAAPYHAGLASRERAVHQDRFLRDEVRVICATVAFGMGINKPNVRFVIHYDLPKNIEGYYQETGRAGRDGLPGDCLLLFSPGDRVKYGRFIDEKTDAKERELARAQLEQIVHYAETAACRRTFLLGYFGENHPGNCDGCDNCLTPRQQWDGTIAAQKFLSCVWRIRQKSNFSVGIQHVVEVLCGADSEKVRRFGHQQLSTYNIGGEHSRAEWSAIGRELVRLGLLFQNSEQFNVVELTAAGAEALKLRRTIMLTKTVQAAEVAKEQKVGAIECDEILFEALRLLRKTLADEHGVPPYIVFSDVSLRQMARSYPQNEAGFARIPGVGEKKLAEYGPAFLALITSHLQKQPRRHFAEEPQAALRTPASLGNTMRESLLLFRQGKTVAEIAELRGLKESTIYSHLEQAILAGEALEVAGFFDEIATTEIEAAIGRLGAANLIGLFEHLEGRYSYGLLRLYRAAAQRG